MIKNDEAVVVNFKAITLRDREEPGEISVRIIGFCRSANTGSPACGAGVRTTATFPFCYSQYISL
jgi:hypothetical protein